LLKNQSWALLLVIGVSLINRVIAYFLYQFSEAFYFWAVWTVILVIFAYLDYRRLSLITKK
jgi:hypothetical protein